MALGTEDVFIANRSQGRKFATPVTLHTGMYWDSYRQMLSCVRAHYRLPWLLKQMAELLIMPVVHTEAVEADCLCVRVCLE